MLLSKLTKNIDGFFCEMDGRYYYYYTHLTRKIFDIIILEDDENINTKSKVRMKMEDWDIYMKVYNG